MNFYQTHLLPKLLDFTMRRREMEKLRSDVITKACGTVLEIGFGSGLNLPYYTHISKLYALDPSLELYKLAKKRIKKVSFPIEYIQASAEKNPLTENSIDTVVSTWTLCSIPLLEPALKEIARVLKPDGKFIFIEHGTSPKKAVATWQKWLTPLSKRLAGGCHMDRKIDTLISDAGFEIQNLKKFQQTSTPLVFMYTGIAVPKKEECSSQL